MDYIDGVEYNDKFISDKALDVLELLTYFQIVGSHSIINRIIFGYNENDNAIENYFITKDIERESSLLLSLLSKDMISSDNSDISDYDCHRKYRVFTDDIVKDIVHVLMKIDDNIFDLVIGEFNVEEKKKSFGLKKFKKKYFPYAKYYNWTSIRKRDDSFTQIRCDTIVWNDFLKIRRQMDLYLEDIFKIAIIRFLEKRYEFCINEIIDDNSE